MLVTQNFTEDRHAIFGLFIKENFSICQQPSIKLIRALIQAIFFLDKQLH